MEKQNFENSQWLLLRLQPGISGLLSVRLRLSPKGHDARGVLQTPVCFIFLLSASIFSYKVCGGFQRKNQNPAREMQTPRIRRAVKKTQWLYDLLRHTREGFLPPDGNLRPSCFFLLCVTKPNCIKLLASKLGSE